MKNNFPKYISVIIVTIVAIFLSVIWLVTQDTRLEPVITIVVLVSSLITIIFNL